jgi:Ca2+-binding EF-hand superfamily protein
MDRNGDGYVSREEFLGTKEAFDRLDRDGDGLISPEEAGEKNK